MKKILLSSIALCTLSLGGGFASSANSPTVYASGGSFGEFLKEGCHWGNWYSAGKALICQGQLVALQTPGVQCELNPAQGYIVEGGGNCINYRVISE